MISFKTFLSEAFDKPYPIRINATDNPKEFMHFEFEDIDDTPYECGIAINRTVGSNKKIVTISFGVRNKKGTDAMYPTGKSSNPMRVYATIGAGLKQFIKGRDDIDYIQYEAAHSSTIKVYRRFAHIIAKQVNGRVIDDRDREMYIKVRE